MPTYSYHCDGCSHNFELFFYIKDYVEKPRCNKCNCKNTHRMYSADVLTQSASVRKSDSELKTIGDLARRNSDKFSEDEKHHLYQKHNSYKYDTNEMKNLPSGMTRINKPNKHKWPGSTKKNKRKPNNG